MDALDRLFAVLKERGIEQKEFAQRAGIHNKIVTDWKKGRSQSYLKMLPQIAAALGTTPEYLLTGKKDPATIPDDGVEAEIMRLLSQLPPEQLKEEVAYLRGIIARRGE